MPIELIDSPDPDEDVWLSYVGALGVYGGVLSPLRFNMRVASSTANVLRLSKLFARCRLLSWELPNAMVIRSREAEINLEAILKDGPLLELGGNK